MTEEKTNVMRLLDQKKIPYTPRHYDVSDGALDAVTAAGRLGVPVESCFKTLVTVGASKRNHVFVVPAAGELDLKAAARAAGEKSIDLLPVKDITAVTGYIRGGCSPVGMKKQYPTVFDETAELFDTICVSAGKIGFQVELDPAALMGLVGAFTADLTV